jgi:hypothetical protein
MATLPPRRAPSTPTRTEEIFNARKRIIADYRRLLQGFFGPKFNEKLVNQAALQQLAAEIDRAAADRALNAPADQAMVFNFSPRLQAALDQVGTATTDLRDEAFNEAVEPNWMCDGLDAELNSYQQRFQQLFEKHRAAANATGSADSFQNAYYYRFLLEIIRIFREQLNTLFRREGGQMSSSRDLTTKFVVRVTWGKTTIHEVRYRRRPSTAPGPKNYHCNGWHHPSGCRCGWGGRRGKSANAGKMERYVVTRTIWLPKIKLVPAPKPLVHA